MINHPQHMMLVAIHKHVTEHGYAITLQELAVEMGITSRSSMHKSMQTLKEKGLVGWLPKQNRTLHLTEAGRDAL